ncbi:xanthine dehydrogenase accessory factor [Tepidamorphus gemmatus]|uniref:Xanthine dehydrogenase accessory factor n=1 Tax=Tepidamorphus gemmatus TaxID=747076 RepID=A0A4R3MEI5_9HYPH|nr:XdhC/CoxI family protein [Tepidamorphus gemmatus]TCT11562.1 xanthine dehydrogenase accessory factor [Tepidamorphus gemmatus]
MVDVATGATDILETAARLKAEGRPFALATVVRTVAATAAKAGAKAVIDETGRITGGWIGGGCARGAVLKAAREALADGAPRLISVQPEDLLAAHGVKPGETREGVAYARSMCPSRGTMDIFIEPVLPRPLLSVMGSSPVAVALAELASRFGYEVAVCAPAEDQAAFTAAERRIETYALSSRPGTRHFVVVATQGRGDEAALKAALSADADYRAFVGSRAKMATLRERLVAQGIAAALIDTVHAPAGLDIGAITPQEIALSILAEITLNRRRGQRGGPAQT